MVWGSDWPHPTETDKPDDAVLFDLLSDWAPDEATRQRILVDNPAKLYASRVPAAPPSARGSWAPSSVPFGWITTAPAWPMVSE